MLLPLSTRGPLDKKTCNKPYDRLIKQAHKESQSWKIIKALTNQKYDFTRHNKKNSPSFQVDRVDELSLLRVDTIERNCCPFRSTSLSYEKKKKEISILGKMNYPKR